MRINKWQLLALFGIAAFGMVFLLTQVRWGRCPSDEPGWRIGEPGYCPTNKALNALFTVAGAQELHRAETGIYAVSVSELESDSFLASGLSYDNPATWVGTPYAVQVFTFDNREQYALKLVEQVEEGESPYELLYYGKGPVFITRPDGQCVCYEPYKGGTLWQMLSWGVFGRKKTCCGAQERE